MKISTLFAALLVLAVSGSAYANLDMAKKHKCDVCHALEVTPGKIGPTWKAIAAKNKGVAGAEAALTDNIFKGNKGGKYGKVAMPPQPGAKADAAALAKWILAQ